MAVSSGIENFLILAYHYLPSPAVGAKRPSHFAKYLERAGYRVRVLTNTPQTVPVEGVTFVPDPATPLRKESLPGLTHMALRKLFFPFEDSVICSWDLYRKAEVIVREAPETWAVFSTFPPVSSHLAAWALRRKYPLRWVADFRDPLAFSPTREFALRPFPALPRFFSPRVDQWIERQIATWADVLVMNTDVVESLWRARYPEAAGKVTHIWNGFDREDNVRAEEIPARPYKVMSHLGSLYHGRHPGMVLESMDRLIRNGRLDPGGFRLQFIGTINYDGIRDRPLFDRLIQLGCVVETGAVPASELRWEADSHLLIDVKEGQQVPSKIFEYIRVGRPILALTSAGSPADRILQKSGVPYLTLPDGTAAEVVDEQFLEFLRLPSEACAASEWFNRQFDAAERVRALLRVLDAAQ